MLGKSQICTIGQTNQLMPNKEFAIKRTNTQEGSSIKMEYLTEEMHGRKLDLRAWQITKFQLLKKIRVFIVNI